MQSLKGNVPSPLRHDGMAQSQQDDGRNLTF